MQIDGKELRITPASFAEAMALQKAVGRALSGQKIGGIPGSMDEEIQGETLASILTAAIGVAISDEVEAAIFKCAERALLGEDKINRDFFEKVENREHYYPIMIEVARVNLSPFFKNLSSMFGDLGVNPAMFQRQK